MRSPLTQLSTGERREWFVVLAAGEQTEVDLVIASGDVLLDDHAWLHFAELFVDRTQDRDILEDVGLLASGKLKGRALLGGLQDAGERRRGSDLVQVFGAFHDPWARERA